MPTIEANTGVVTQINVFTCAPEKQQALIEHLIQAATFGKQIPGWMSASIHKGLDGKSVVNYAQAENDEAQARIFAALKDTDDPPAFPDDLAAVFNHIEARADVT